MYVLLHHILYCSETYMIGKKCFHCEGVEPGQVAGSSVDYKSVAWKVNGRMLQSRPVYACCETCTY